VSYVFWGPAEQSLGDWDPHAKEYLQNIYAQGGYEIFAVQEDSYEE